MSTLAAPFHTRFFRRSSGDIDVKPGYIYRRLHAGNLTELVTVTELRNDALGIPHVRFTVTFERPAGVPEAPSTRVLALKTFVDAYRNRVS
jgi:hypothetical protein